MRWLGEEGDHGRGDGMLAGWKSFKARPIVGDDVAHRLMKTSLFYRQTSPRTTLKRLVSLSLLRILEK